MTKFRLRLKEANYSNEPQCDTVIGFTLFNFFAVLAADNPPWWVIQAALLFWPLLAFIFNLLSPLPQPKKTHAFTEVPSKESH